MLSRPLLAAAEGQEGAAAAQAAHDLLGVVSEPKQAAPVLATAARLVSGVMQQSSRAGAALIGHLADRLAQLSAASLASSSSSRAGAAAAAAATAAAAVAGQQLDACLHFAALLGGSSTLPLQAALLLCLPRLLPLVRHPSSTTRRLALDLCTALLPPASQLPRLTVAPEEAAAEGPADCEDEHGAAAAAAEGEAPAEPAPAVQPPAAQLSYRDVLLTALVSRLSDRDATLRGKALGCLGKHAQLAAAHLQEAAAAGAAAGGSAGPASSGLLPALCARLCDKSPSVRKRAAALLAALLQQAAGLGQAGAAALAAAALPVASQLLGVRADSALHPGAEGVPVSDLAAVWLTWVLGTGWLECTLPDCRSSLPLKRRRC